MYRKTLFVPLALVLFAAAPAIQAYAQQPARPAPVGHHYEVHISAHSGEEGKCDVIFGEQSGSVTCVYEFWRDGKIQEVTASDGFHYTRPGEVPATNFNSTGATSFTFPSSSLVFPTFFGLGCEKTWPDHAIGAFLPAYICWLEEEVEVCDSSRSVGCIPFTVDTVIRRR